MTIFVPHAPSPRLAWKVTCWWVLATCGAWIFYAWFSNLVWYQLIFTIGAKLSNLTQDGTLSASTFNEILFATVLDTTLDMFLLGGVVGMLQAAVLRRSEWIVPTWLSWIVGGLVYAVVSLFTRPYIPTDFFSFPVFRAFIISGLVIGVIQVFGFPRQHAARLAVPWISATVVGWCTIGALQTVLYRQSIAAFQQQQEPLINFDLRASHYGLLLGLMTAPVVWWAVRQGLLFPPPEPQHDVHVPSAAPAASAHSRQP